MSEDLNVGDCAAEGCLNYAVGGSCARCGYPKAYTHPDCVSDAMGMRAVYCGGTPMTVTGSSDVPIGIVNVSRRDGLGDQYFVPRYLKVGDSVSWGPALGCPLALWLIDGIVDEMIEDHPILRVCRVAGPEKNRPEINALLDTSVGPGTMQRWSSSASGSASSPSPAAAPSGT